mmetsp:Transcript_29887/g.63658  ORF Transcript_29887/g.63658 Transcript_29887/m.63658 type:complete len:206 (-) Transcript_29887:420-1037(-)
MPIASDPMWCTNMSHVILGLAFSSNARGTKPYSKTVSRKMCERAACSRKVRVFLYWSWIAKSEKVPRKERKPRSVAAEASSMSSVHQQRSVFQAKATPDTVLPLPTSRFMPGLTGSAATSAMPPLSPWMLAPMRSNLPPIICFIHTTRSADSGTSLASAASARANAPEKATAARVRCEGNDPRPAGIERKQKKARQGDRTLLSFF